MLAERLAPPGPNSVPAGKDLPMSLPAPDSRPIDSYFSRETPPPAVVATPADGPSRDLLESLRHRVHGRLLQQLELAEVRRLPEDRRRDELRPAVERVLDNENPYLLPADRERLVGDLLDEVLGLG